MTIIYFRLGDEFMAEQENYDQQDLDLWGVDYDNSENLPVVKSKPIIESNLLMRFRSQLNKVVWKGLNSAQTKIITVIFSKIGDKLTAYQNQEIQNYISQKKSKGKTVTKDDIKEKIKSIEITAKVSAHIS